MRYLITTTFFVESDNEVGTVRAVVYDMLDSAEVVDRIKTLFVEQDEPTEAELERHNASGYERGELAESQSRIQRAFK